MSEDLRRDVEQDRALWQAGYRAGLEQGRTEVSCPHIHPLISDSASRIFAGWDGAGAAGRRSVERFRRQQGADR